jgi:hypothetical protein
MNDAAEEEIRRGRRAEQILNDDVFKDAIDEIRSAIVAKWRASHPQDAEVREHLKMLDHATELVIGMLRSYAASGKIRFKELERRKSSTRKPA